jgi:hypothetical protein
METTGGAEDVALIVTPNPSPSNGNPYILPFSMAFILNEEIVRTELQNEAKELLDQFETWSPKTKVLKDVKWRLEAVRERSRL